MLSITEGTSALCCRIIPACRVSQYQYFYRSMAQNHENIVRECTTMHIAYILRTENIEENILSIKRYL